jgi:hypothetical protein
MNALATAQVNDSPSWGVRRRGIQCQSAAWILFPAPSYGAIKEIDYTRVLYSIYARGVNTNRLWAVPADENDLKFEI